MMCSMAKTVFQYHQNIYILEDPVAYRKEVVNYLDLIRTTYTGRTLLKYIYSRGRRLLILPYVPAKETKFGPVNAYATPDTTLDAYAKNFPVNGTMNIPSTGARVDIPINLTRLSSDPQFYGVYMSFVSSDTTCAAFLNAPVGGVTSTGTSTR